MTDDPFANLDKTGETSTDTVSDAESYFAAEMTIGEEEFEQPKEFIPYTMPEDRSWVPVEIISAEVASRKMRVLVTEGGEKKPAEVDIDQFVLEVQHLSDAYGERAYPYRLYVPVFDIELPTKNNRTWTKSSGRRLLAATRVTKPGQRITPETLPELAAAMVGKHIMGQIRHVTKDYTDSKPRTTANGEFVKAKVDDDGVPLRVIEVEGQLVMETSDTPVPVGKDRLIEYKGGYLIPDPDGKVVSDIVTTTKTFDNLQDDVAPIPNREIAVTKLDGKDVKATVTIQTVGRMATRPVKPGTQVTAVDAKGNEYIASWIGTSWNEAKADSFDAFKGDAA